MKDFNGNYSKEQGLFKLAQQSTVTRNFIWFCVFAFLIMIVPPFIPAVIGEILFNKGLITPVFKTAIFSLGLGFGISALIIFAIVKYREHRSLDGLGFIKKNIVKNYFFGFGVGLLSLGLAALLIYVFKGYNVITSGNIGIQFLPTILLMLLGWLIQGATEEIVCRGWMLPLLGRRYNVPFAIIITSLFFAALHSANNGITLIPVLNLILFGLFAALYVVKTKNIWGICGFHSAWNWMQGNILGVQVSGTTVAGGSIIQLESTGNTLISGGSFGIEGSIFCTLIYLVGIGFLFYTLRSKTNDSAFH